MEGLQDFIKKNFKNNEKINMKKLFQLKDEPPHSQRSLTSCEISWKMVELETSSLLAILGVSYSEKI